MSNKFVDVEVIQSVGGGEKQRCITSVDWEGIRDSVVYQGVVIKKNNDDSYAIEEPTVKDDGSSTIVSKTVKTDLPCGFEVGDVVEYDDVYGESCSVCSECMSDSLYDEQKEEYYCPKCES